MNTVKVQNRSPWCAVPEALLQDGRLGHAAARLGAWLSGRPDGWEVKKWHAMKVLHLGETLWDRSTRELKAAGYLITVPVRSGGRWAGQDYIFDPMGQHPCAPSEDNPTPPEADLPGAVGPGTVEPGAVGHPFNNTTSPTQHLKQNTTTTARARDAADVVVVNQEDQDQLIWPTGLAEDQLTNMRGVLLGKAWPGVTDAQALLDELAGQLAVPGKVKNPPGLLRRLMERQRKGEFTMEFGLEVQQIRKARRKNEERQAAGTGVQRQQQQPAGETVSGRSEVALRERQRQLQKNPEVAKKRAAKAAGAHP